MAHPAPPDATEVPALLADRYEVGDLLGVGGMARVHRGHDRVLDRPVAIKLLAGDAADDPRFLAQFAREARAAAGLIHPNAVTVFDTGVDGERHFIVMELVEGGTLRDRLMEEGPVPPERARRYAIDIARALTAAHARGLVHRDVKPGNVLLDAAGKPKVADFGIAHAAEDEHTGGVVLGTAAYLSPEQARGEPTTPASDVYSLGCVLYEMLAGQQPYTADSPVAVAAKHVYQAPAPIQTLQPSVPPPLAAVVERALRKSPTDRYPDAGAMLAALEAAATTAGLPGRLPPQAAPRRSRALRVATWAAAAVMVALIAVFAPAFIRTTEPEPVPPADASETPSRTRVPDVVGLSEREAGEALREAGLIPVFRGEALGDGVQAVVISQDPAPGSRVEEETFVTLELASPHGSTGSDRGGGAKKDGDAGAEDRSSAEQEGGSGDAGGSSGDGDGAETSPEPSPSPSPSPSPTASPSS